MKLRDSDFSDDAILHRAKQIMYERGGSDAKLVMSKLIESPRNDLSGLIQVVNGYLDKEKEKFEIDMFVEISDVFDLQDAV